MFIWTFEGVLTAIALGVMAVCFLVGGVMVGIQLVKDKFKKRR